MARNGDRSPIHKGLSDVGTEMNNTPKSASDDNEEKSSSCSSNSSSSSSSSGSTTATRRRPWKVSPARSLSAAGSLKSGGGGGGDATQVATEPNSKSNSNRHLLLLRRHSAIFPHRLRRDFRSFCFCCFCCCSCTCMSGKKSQRKEKGDVSSPAGQDNSDNEPLPSVEEIRSWGESFDRLMKCPAGRNLFRKYLQYEFSEENILFWLACEELKMECNPEVIEEKCRVIYEDFVSILSPREVSLDSKVRDQINQNMLKPSKNTFDDAQMQIYTLMGRDSYPRFVISTIYRNVAQLSPSSTKESVRVG